MKRRKNEPKNGSLHESVGHRLKGVPVATFSGYRVNGRKLWTIRGRAGHFQFAFNCGVTVVGKPLPSGSTSGILAQHRGSTCGAYQHVWNLAIFEPSGLLLLTKSRLKRS